MSEIPTDKDNFLRFVYFFIVVGTKTVLKVFYYFQRQNPSIVTFPISRTAPIAKQLQRVFVESQYYTLTNATSPDDLEINTLITLLCTLFSGVLPTPVNGWGGEPKSVDHSISADLLRLRSIRHDVIERSIRASLSSADFDRLWKTVEDILKRLDLRVDPGNEEKLKETFKEYRQTTIGASTAEKYVDISQKQVDELKQMVQALVTPQKEEMIEKNVADWSNTGNQEIDGPRTAVLKTTEGNSDDKSVDALSEELIAQMKLGLAKRTDISNTEVVQRDVLKSTEGNLDDKSEHPSRSQIEIDKQWANARKEDLDKAKIIDVCNAVCSDIIKENPESVLSVRPAYDSTDKDHIQFIVTTKEDSDNTKFDFKYSTVVRRANTSYSNEANVAMKNTGNEEIKLSFEDSERIKLVINNRSEELFNKHRYLSVISGSGIRSRENSQGKRELIPEVCIVLYVQTKGKIPLDETEFPKFLNNIPVDVMEGEFKTCVGPVEFQTNLCMGCQIQAGNKVGVGTLGGFIEHPEYGLSAITCAHVVLNDAELHDIQRDGKKTWNDRTKSMFQPDKTDIQHHYFGQVKEARYKSGGNGKSGVDLAVVKIERRHSLSGHFPGANAANVGDDMNFKTGQACFSLNENNIDVVKFGCTTGKTNGVVNFPNAAVKLLIDHEHRYIQDKRLHTYRLFNQFFVKSTRGRFVQGGDSGSLVFKKDVTGKFVCIGMVVGGLTNTGDGIITPISAILSELGVNSFKDFSLNEIENRLSKMEEKIDLLLQ